MASTMTTRRNIAGTLDRLARARLDDVTFRQEAIELLRRAVDFDAWCWTLIDPGTELPSPRLGRHREGGPCMRAEHEDSRRRASSHGEAAGDAADEAGDL
ncbi:MAG: hypothetical protein J2P45_28650 [Candidatus Dormibacteraeota bacterium]|nr:hypothetical protein [Candidatus Dormibacteraeota bacterium]